MSREDENKELIILSSIKVRKFDENEGYSESDKLWEITFKTKNVIIKLSIKISQCMNLHHEINEYKNETVL